MRIAIITGGGRGDVQPFIALAQAIDRACQQAIVLVQSEFAPLVEAAGVKCVASTMDVRALVDSPDYQKLVGSGRNPIAFMRSFKKLVTPFAEQAAAELQVGMTSCDAAIPTSMTMLTGTAINDCFVQPYCCAFPAPITPTAEFESALMPAWPRWLPFGASTYNRFSHWLVGRLLRLLFGGVARRISSQLPAARSRRPHELPRPLLYGFSPVVVPPPADWDATHHVTGYWFLDAPNNWRPPNDLLAFLDAGPAPVYIGFGSMAGREPAATMRLVIDALAKVKQRAVVTAGWGTIERSQLPDTIFAADSIPHDWLFSRVAAVVHHGGAGTTAAGLRAGVPSVVIPHMGDQPFWARRVHALGAGPNPIARKRLAVANLAAALDQAVVDQAMRERCRMLGETIRAEHGADNAAAVASEYFERALR